MPLTAKGQEILATMQRDYGAEKGKQVFYASLNAGKLTGVHKKRIKKRKTPQEQRLEAQRGTKPKSALERALERRRGINPAKGD